MSIHRRELLLAGACMMVACADDAATKVDELRVLHDLAEIVIKPSFGHLAETAAALKEAGTTLAAEATADSLALAQAAWRETQSAWNEARVFGFGPTKEVEANIRWSKGCEPEAVEQVIALGPPFNPTSLGATRKGLPALEYLLFDVQAGNEAVLAALLASENRRSFLVTLVNDLAVEINNLVIAFAKHAEALATAGVESDVYKSPKDALDALFNQMIYAADLAIQTIATPLGINTGVLSPELEESRRSDNTLQDTLSLLAGVAAVYRGDYADLQGLGVGDLINDRSPSLDSDFQAVLDNAVEYVSTVPGPLRTALENEVELLAETVEALRKVKRLLASDLATALGVTISFSDMDGD